MGVSLGAGRGAVMLPETAGRLIARCQKCHLYLGLYVTEEHAPALCAECRRLEIHLKPLVEVLQGVREALHSQATAIQSVLLRYQVVMREKEQKGD